ncbi:MAG: hypothetical protein OXD47_02670 [Gammaproteobacteria bacterium]|nr:hypothetical protein [Gammaproteobacteria bacterium]MCY4211192.1 hypothetical protein [Gammaproteobacteria bacterium]MCY4337683.1 hypothetical protein [Gammaproteobacteria bacterium]
MNSIVAYWQLFKLLTYRVGLTSELTARDASTTKTMLAGNWKTSRMVAHYSAGATAGQTTRM